MDAEEPAQAQRITLEQWRDFLLSQDLAVEYDEAELLLWDLGMVKFRFDMATAENRPPVKPLQKILKAAGKLRAELEHPVASLSLRRRGLWKSAVPERISPPDRFDRLFRDLTWLLEVAPVVLEEAQSASRATPRSAMDRAIDDVAKIGIERLGVPPQAKRTGQPEGPIIDFIEGALAFIGHRPGRETIITALYRNRADRRRAAALDGKPETA